MKSENPNKIAIGLRLVLIISGILVLGIAMFNLFYPEYANSETSTVQPKSDRILSFIGQIIFVSVLLYPAGYPRNLIGVLIRLTLSGYGVYIMIRGGIEGILAYFQGGKDPLIVLFSLLMISVGILVPVYIVKFRSTLNENSVASS